VVDSGNLSFALELSSPLLLLPFSEWMRCRSSLSSIIPLGSPPGKGFEEGEVLATVPLLLGFGASNAARSSAARGCFDFGRADRGDVTLSPFLFLAFLHKYMIPFYINCMLWNMPQLGRQGFRLFILVLLEGFHGLDCKTGLAGSLCTTSPAALLKNTLNRKIHFG